MRAALAFASLSLLAPAAFAEGPDAPLPPAAVRTVSASAASASPSPAPFALDETTRRCQPLAKRASIGTVPQALSARVLLASCIADARIAVLSLIDGQESVLAMEEAVEPAIAMLDGVIAAGDPGLKISALHAKADLYGRMAAKMMDTVPPPANTTPEAAALRETRREIIAGMLGAWRDHIQGAHQAIVDLGRKHPALAKNPVAQATIRESERVLAEQVARAEAE